MRNVYRQHPAFVLLLWDVLLAFVMWHAAFVLQGLLWRWPASALPVANIVSSVAVSVWVRAALGSDPGNRLDRAHELRRPRYALLATPTLINVFAFASPL